MTLLKINGTPLSILFFCKCLLVCINTIAISLHLFINCCLDWIYVIIIYVTLIYVISQHWVILISIFLLTICVRQLHFFVICKFFFFFSCFFRILLDFAHSLNSSYCGSLFIKISKGWNQVSFRLSSHLEALGENPLKDHSRCCKN